MFPKVLRTARLLQLVYFYFITLCVSRCVCAHTCVHMFMLASAHDLSRGQKAALVVGLSTFTTYVLSIQLR